ncbi:N-acetyl-gamma-glutamyl-phosphate reductase [Desulfonauticus submarinus]|uniref:N-acetyl-gamma-glutamyl-phosphate reductase n=1 Tax=Desulfonauticus submarinus TaxID=206665 RepID=A0A1H0ELP9_9BACT|nr:N-acetyl-gamma-glutamyl-phosphate reductase [Desulfonauticus submarinus]SDN83338.1 N-acetyl-gamma-glutamyl-phosphate reductase [Desulfonauticus submarinus]
MGKINVGIVGISGYTGIELLRLLCTHPFFELKQATSRKLRGKKIKEVFPFADKFSELIITDIEKDGLDADIELYFLAVPHGTAMKLAQKIIQAGKKVVDLSADFRLKNKQVYEEWYKVKHVAWDLMSEAVYGLPEIYASKIKNSRLVANPGCYPTSAILALYPALKSGLIDSNEIIIDSKSGTTGAGRSPKENILFCEVYDNFFAYNIGKHRHSPEIEQECSLAAGRNIKILFSTHLLPINRGILTTVYVKTKELKIDKIRDCYLEFYGHKKWVKVLEDGVLPQVRWVRGTISCALGLVIDQKTEQLIIVSAIDNLCRGASGQALLNANLMVGFEEDTGFSVSAPLIP